MNKKMIGITVMKTILGDHAIWNYLDSGSTNLVNVNILNEYMAMSVFGVIFEYIYRHT